MKFGDRRFSPAFLHLLFCGFFFYCLVFVSGVSAASAEAESAAETPQKQTLDHIKYYRKGMSSGMHAYNEAIIHLALEKSRSLFGDYEISYFEEKVSPPRARLETELNRNINVNIAGSWIGPYANKDKVSSLCHAHFQNLMGLRTLIIRETDQGEFAKIKTKNDLLGFKLVQDKTWPDSDILASNGLEVTGFIGMENLLRTLSNKRVDYLPLSVLEAQNLLKDSLTTYPTDDLMFFYPHPGCVYVSKQTPRIAERLEKGFELAKADGSLNLLFSSYFSEVENFIKSKRRLIFILDNPNLNEADNLKFTNEFITRFKSYVEIAN